MSEKPAVLIIGGMGYIGRFLALHIQKNNLASEVRIVDKVLPQLAWLAPEFEEACSKDKFMQADASKERKFSPKIHCLFCGMCLAPVNSVADDVIQQNPSPAYSIAPMGSSGTTYSIAVAKHDTRRRMRSTRCARWH